jgi:2-C-methyl-D-erythritol 4-phosphate cytidylyltransferase
MGVKYWGVVPAAGIGRRMGASVPKQYLSLAGRQVIDHTLARLLELPLLEGVFVAIAEGDPLWPSVRCASHPKVTRVSGGAERSDSVIRALDVLIGAADPDDWVLVHDAARPCLRRTDLERLIQRVTERGEGGLLGMPVRDTIKRADPSGEVVETVSRAGLWHAFTPQMFRLAHLQDALKAAERVGVSITDEATAVELAGGRPLLVEGAADNIKITRPEDLQLAEVFLARQRAGEL